MSFLEILLDPGDQVVLECTLDCLMEEVGSKQFVNICTREAGCKWLQIVQLNFTLNMHATHIEIVNKTVLIPQLIDRLCS